MDAITITFMAISVSDMRKVEKYAQSIGISALIMMENAGANAARIVHERINLSGKQVAVFCWTGNNGGDGFVFARHAMKYGAKVSIILVKAPESIRTDEARINYTIIKNLKAEIYAGKVPQVVLKDADVACDAMLGTGLKDKVKEPYQGMIDVFNKMKCLKVSLDCPSGIDADTGDVLGVAVRPDITVTFHDAKKGLNRENSGEIILADIGFKKGG